MDLAGSAESAASPSLGATLNNQQDASDNPLVPGPRTQRKNPIPLLQIKQLLNFYLFGIKYWKHSNKFNKEGQILPTTPYHTPRHPHR